MDKKLKAISPVLKEVRLSNEEGIKEYVEGLFDFEDDYIDENGDDYTCSDETIIKDWRKVIIQLVKDWKDKD